MKKESICLKCKKKCKDKNPVTFCSCFEYELTDEDKKAAIEFAISRVNWHRRLRGLPDSSTEELEETRKHLTYLIYGKVF